MRKEDKSTGTFNSVGFHTGSAVDFGFASISVTVSDVSIAMSVTVCDRGERGRLAPKFYPYILQHFF